MRTFREFIEAVTPNGKELPLVHATQCKHLNSIATSHLLAPKRCPVFKESLLYFFYGRPAYRDTDHHTPARAIPFYPLCFIFRPETVSKSAKRVFPFDSGAAVKSYYEPAVAASDALLRYAVAPTITSARQIIGAFFETPEDYVRANPKPRLTTTKTDKDARQYHKLINGGGHPDCDDRYSATEFSSEKPAKLRGDLMAVVLPLTFFRDEAKRPEPAQAPQLAARTKIERDRVR